MEKEGKKEIWKKERELGDNNHNKKHKYNDKEQKKEEDKKRKEKKSNKKERKNKQTNERKKSKIDTKRKFEKNCTKINEETGLPSSVVPRQRPRLPRKWS